MPQGVRNNVGINFGRGVPNKIWGPKTSKIWSDFWQLST